MNKKIIKISVLFIFILVIAYITSYLSLRRTETFNQQGSWVIYFYDKSFVRQYALDERSKMSFKNAIERGDTSFFVGHEGDVGEDWFCVYRKSNTKFYRLFGLAEQIENLIKFSK